MIIKPYDKEMQLRLDILLFNHKCFKKYNQT